jgi:hypothetical protein
MPRGANSKREWLPVEVSASNFWKLRKTLTIFLGAFVQLTNCRRDFLKLVAALLCGWFAHNKFVALHATDLHRLSIPSGKFAKKDHEDFMKAFWNRPSDQWKRRCEFVRTDCVEPSSKGRPDSFLFRKP